MLSHHLLCDTTIVGSADGVSNGQQEGECDMQLLVSPDDWEVLYALQPQGDPLLMTPPLPHTISPAPPHSSHNCEPYVAALVIGQPFLRSPFGTALKHVHWVSSLLPELLSESGGLPLFDNMLSTKGPYLRPGH